jgi:carboxyl-terminal processing protease
LNFSNLLFVKAAEPCQLVDGAIKGMISSLDDPYSSYMDPQEGKSFEETISLTFKIWSFGLTPAFSAGDPLIGDTIRMLPSFSSKGLNVNEAVALIRGKKGTNVKLVLHRAGVGDLNHLQDLVIRFNPRFFCG